MRHQHFILWVQIYQDFLKTRANYATVEVDIIVNDVQQDADILAYLFLTKISSTCFGRCLRQSPGALDCI